MAVVNGASLLILLLLGSVSGEVPNKRPVTADECNGLLSPALQQEIAGYSGAVNTILDYILDGAGKGEVYNRLTVFVDKFGPRFAGSQTLEDSIDFLLNETLAEGLESVAEDADVAYWDRGSACVELLSPRVASLGVLALGSSVATPPEGIQADVLVVRNFDELATNSDQVNGKIVVFNHPWAGYGESVEYREYGASMAAPLGALAVLVRSVTPYSIYSLHTGWQDYDPLVKKIPSASITVEDAEMLQRMSDRGERIVINVTLTPSDVTTRVSRNLVADLKGSANPEQLVLVSGHIDSWDVGQGAMDDGAGSFISWLAPVVLRRLGLQPLRTVRGVLWTAEEAGYYGAISYRVRHNSEIADHLLAMESDSGAFSPIGLSVSASNQTTCIIREIMQLLSRINATQVITPADESDINVFHGEVPTAGLETDAERYFNFHHTNGDTMLVLDADELDRCLALWTAVSYVVADLSMPLPR